MIRFNQFCLKYTQSSLGQFCPIFKPIGIFDLKKVTRTLVYQWKLFVSSQRKTFKTYIIKYKYFITLETTKHKHKKTIPCQTDTA